MSDEQIHLQVSHKLFRVNSWIAQMIRGSEFQTVGPAAGPKGAVANSRNWQLMTSGRLQMLTTRNFRDWHTVVGEVQCHGARWRRQRWTVTASVYCTV